MTDDKAPAARQFAPLIEDVPTFGAVTCHGDVPLTVTARRVVSESVYEGT